MLSVADASPQTCASLPALIDEIARSLEEVAHLLQTSAIPDADNAVAALADATHRLSEVQGALLMIDQQALAALVCLLRAQLPACGKAGHLHPEDAESATRELRRVIRSALEGLLGGRTAVAGELLACWQRIAALSDGSTMHPAALISLQFDAAMVPLLRPMPLSGIGLEDAEPALLDFLRAQEDTQRSAAALRIADVLAHACAKTVDADEHARWLALRAYLIEFAQAGEDLARTKKIVAGMTRALRPQGQRAATLAQLAREALFELAQRELVTDEAREVARLFDLRKQFSEPAEEHLERHAEVERAKPLDDAVIAVIATVEAETNKLFDADCWHALADAAAGSSGFLAAEGWLREIAAQLEQWDSDSLAMLLLCLRACAQESDQSIASLPRLMNATRGSEPVAQLQAWSQARSTDRLMRDLSETLRSDMLSAEQSLDTTTSVDVARQTAVAALTRIAGALELLALDDDCHTVLALRSRLDAAETFGTVFDEQTSLQWVQLQTSFVLLPWRLRASRTEPTLPVSDEEVSRLVDDGVESLEAIFINEAANLLRELRAYSSVQGTLDDSALMHIAHTLAGCSSTVGATGIAELAQALEEALARGAAAEPSLIMTTVETLDAMLAEFAVSGRCESEPALVDRWRQSMPASPPAAEDGAGSDGRDQQAVVQQLIDPMVALPTLVADDEANESLVARDTRTPDVEPQPEMPDAEAELLAIFNEEAADLLPQIEQAVRAWQLRPDDREQPAQLLRVLHTLKGSARMAGQQSLGEDFHRAEAEISALAHQAPSAVIAQLPALLERVDRWLQSLSGISLPAESERSASTEPIPVATASQPPLTETPASMLRVRADQLAQFADSGAEIWVGNARLREGLQEQRRTVADLADDLARLRTQLRELEIEAESRILSRAAQGSASDFDPLEFDRYTRLHELTRMMAESITDIAGVQRGLTRQVEALSSAASAQARDLRRQQSALQVLRSQPLKSVDARLRRLLRQAARESGRNAELVIEGGEIEIERGLLDRLMGPLEHLLRNAVVHGIEPPDEREQCGKPREGKITLMAALAGNELRLTLSDDGRGLDLARIRERALAVGLLRDAEPGSQLLAALIFEPGFSTASEVTALSGRGIGMDVVRVELQALGGHIHVDSEPGQGCSFSIRLPAAMASVQVMLATAGGRRIALPATQLQQVLQVDLAQIKSDNDGSLLDWQGGTVRLLHLGHALGDVGIQTDNTRVPVALLRDGERVLAIQLDAIDGQREVIVKHPGAQLAQVPGMAGATLLGDGGIALIIDPFRLPAIASFAAPRSPVKCAPLVLVVDDSLTVRRASQRLLERHGYAVALARDGIEALEQLQQQRPAAVLLDIEMPRMDGFELLAALRDDARLQALPVVMITSRIAERHRERATMLGATAYMGKPYDEDALLGLLSQLCSVEAAVA